MRHLILDGQLRTALPGNEKDRLTAWRRVVQFLQPERTDVASISVRDVARVLNLTARTSSDHQRDRVPNYHEVESTRISTEFEPLLHRR